MKIKFINLSVLFVFLISLYSCTTAKEVLGGKKRSEQSDEFLVEKKNSLAMPPDFENYQHQNPEVSPKHLVIIQELKLLNIEDFKEG